MEPLNIATDGYIEFSSIGVATNGYLSIAGEIVVDLFRHTENIVSQLVNRIRLRSRLWLS